MAERQILKAQASGALEGLEGEGKPLPERPGDAFVEAGDAAGFRIMAQAGVLPEEIALKKQILAAYDHLRSLTDEPARRAQMAEIAKLEMRRSIAEEARRRFLRN